MNAKGQDRETRGSERLGRGRTLPRETGAAPLDFVIGVMAFLAALALGGVLIAGRTAENWQTGLSGRVTVQILPQENAVPEQEVAAALAVLRGWPGIARADALSQAENLALVAPWLGNDAVVSALPFPTLIDVAVTPGATLNVKALQDKLMAASPHAVVDDHSRWIAQLKGVAKSIVWGALAILLLIALATSATVAFATRAGLEAHHEIVELLHFMGARDNFIAKAFEWHYFLAALAAAAMGSLVAAGAFLTAGGLDLTNLPAVPFLPPLGLSINELPWLATIPAGAAIIAWFTARFSVFAALRKFY